MVKSQIERGCATFGYLGRYFYLSTILLLHRSNVPFCIFLWHTHAPKDPYQGHQERWLSPEDMPCSSPGLNHLSRYLNVPLPPIYDRNTRVTKSRSVGEPWWLLAMSFIALPVGRIPWSHTLFSRPSTLRQRAHPRGEMCPRNLGARSNQYGYPASGCL